MFSCIERRSKTPNILQSTSNAMPTLLVNGTSSNGGRYPNGGGTMNGGGYPQLRSKTPTTDRVLFPSNGTNGNSHDYLYLNGSNGGGKAVAVNDQLYTAVNGRTSKMMLDHVDHSSNGVGMIISQRPEPQQQQQQQHHVPIPPHTASPKAAMRIINWMKTQ